MTDVRSPPEARVRPRLAPVLSPRLDPRKDEAEEHGHLDGEYFGGYYKVLTTMEQMGHLGVNLSRVPPGRTACPFHTHQREDEVFIVLEGRGILRYGDSRFDIGPGDCVSCEAGTGRAHQIGNTGNDDLVYLAIGYNDPDEVCTYPDSGKVMIRALGEIGRIESAEYGDGEPEPPKILDPWRTEPDDRK